MFCILEIRTESDILFKEELSGSPFAMRPLFLILCKEITPNLQDANKAINDRKETSSFNVRHEMETFSVKLEA